MGGNAIKFTKKGSVSIKAQLSESENSLNTNAVNVELIVEDTGMGVPQDQQQKIFESFEQIVDQDHKQYGGTGLGLTICKQLVELMNGEIQLTSEKLQITAKFSPIVDGRVLESIFAPLRTGGNPPTPVNASSSAADTSVRTRQSVGGVSGCEPANTIIGAMRRESAKSPAVDFMRNFFIKICYLVEKTFIVD